MKFFPLKIELCVRSCYILVNTLRCRTAAQQQRSSPKYEWKLPHSEHLELCK